MGSTSLSPSLKTRIPRSGGFKHNEPEEPVVTEEAEPETEEEAETEESSEAERT